MQLTVREVSKLLDVPDTTVVRWIKQRGLPAQYVGGKYRCHRAELLEWATTNHVKVAAELFDSVQDEDEPVQVLFSLISPTMRSHLQLLARLSFALHDAAFKDVVLRQGPREKILQEVRRVEATLAPRM